MRHHWLLLMLAPVLLGACSEWPRAAHVPETAGDVPSTTDPRALVVVDWTDLEDDDLGLTPVDSGLASLDLGQGLSYTGSVPAAGWDSEASVPDLSDPSCDADQAELPARGWYAGGARFAVVEAGSDGVLCARVKIANATGIDLIPFDAAGSDCLTPVQVVLDGEDEAIGFNKTSPHGWAIPVTAGDVVVVMFGAYAPETTTPHTSTFAVSLIDAPDAASAVCPFLQGEVVQ